MKRFFLLLAAALTLSSCAVMQNLNSERLLQGGVYIAQALSLTDQQVEAYVAQYIQQSDAQNQVLPGSNAYTKRLRKLTEDYVSSNAKIKKALGVERMPVDAREGLQRTLESFR